ncbi:hypothetical protein K488DRAFT_53236 [Vararia minispora EC-137]|uniref:Uncharacterized protein n=1 Tax=Vararia minispora EC-137 TaxID=1314806 RepID=A0ACB8QHV1_9AGAM|nr:hypothetical protein K488DRAFT_53236 [Vararia minispora EC-137]
MIPLIPTLALAFFSFFASTFVILRIVLPILPPHPLSRRVRPSEFGLPNFRSISAADKSHVWLAACDIVVLALFIWEALMQYYGSPAGYATASDVGSSVRIWLALSLRQTCLLVVSCLTLLHVRLGRPVAFGGRHWMLWAPMLVLVAFSTAIAGVVSGVHVKTFFFGTIGYTVFLALGSTFAFAGLFGTLVVIKRNLQTIDDTDSWPPARDETKIRRSFAPEDVEALRDGSSWITSRADSDRESISAFSFSTHNTHVQHPAAASHPSIPAKSSYWFNPSTSNLNGNAHDLVPPVPPLPSPYRARVCGDDHPDPFRRSESPHEHVARVRNGSQASWLTSTSGTRPTMTAWSFPTSRPSSPVLDAAVASTQDLNSHLLRSSRPNTPALSSARVLGGYGYVPPSPSDHEKGLSKLATESSNEIDVSVFRILTWLAGIWVPFALSIPYLATLNATHPNANMVVSVLLILSITLPSPLLALNILMRHGVPIPAGLFDPRKEPPSVVHRAPSPADTLTAPSPFSAEYKRSTSMTVVEGRRSTDVWLAKGEAVDGKSRIGRALGMLAPAPKLSVLPPEDTDAVIQEPLTPPLPIQDMVPTVPPTPQSSNEAELGHASRARTKSSASSARMSEDAELAFTARVMVAQRHYSHMALTMVLPPSPDREGPSMPATPTDAINMGAAIARATGVAVSTPPARGATHLRTRSTSSWSSPRFPVSPAPPTPPTAITHRKSHSSFEFAGAAQSSFDFGTIPRDDAATIDKLSAGLLPLLVPGLKVGADVRVSTSDVIPSPPLSSGLPSSSRRTSFASRKLKASATLEFGGYRADEFSGPQVHTTPYRARARKTSAHKRHHFSLPSLALGKDGAHSLAKWLKDTDTALDMKVQEYRALGADATVDRRRTVALAPSSVRPSPDIPAPTADSLLPPSTTSSTFPTSSFVLPTPAELMIPESGPVSIPPLPSASSDQTLFDLEGVAPLAESTPPDYRRRSGRSSITYIRSDNAGAPRRIRMPKLAARFMSSSRLPPISSSGSPDANDTPEKSDAVAGGDRQDRPQAYAALPTAPAAGGLRPLSLLQDHSNSSSAVRGLSIGKRGSSKGKRAAAALGKNENVDKENISRVDSKGKEQGHRRLRSLKLGRSDTTKERAVLRANEVVPNVVVRPPSDIGNLGLS